MIAILRAVIVIWLAVTGAFFLLRVIPGDAISNELIASGIAAEIIEERQNALGLLDPVMVQYGRYLAGLVQGDFGVSLLSGQPVGEILVQRFAPTFTLALSALVVAVGWGVIVGFVAALGQRLSVVARGLMHLALSTPIYWTGTIAIYVFTVQFRIVPQSIVQVALPILVLGFHTSGVIAQLVYTQLLELKDTDFIRTAHAKGLPNSTIWGRHLFRALLLPLTTIVILQAGFLLSGTVIAENLFARPGIGRLLVDSTLRQDLPVIQGIVVLSAFIYAFLNIFGDFVARFIDPRVD